MKDILVAFRLFVVLTILTGLVYPLLVTGAAQGLFASKANGSLIVKDGKVLGSDLIGQPFSDSKYFWGRPSATGPFPYNASASSGSNLGPTNPTLVGDDKVEGVVTERVKSLRDADPSATQPIPTQLVTASGSGLDPHVSPEAALHQVSRVAKARSLPVEKIKALVEKHIEPRSLGILGEPVVNVLRLNLDLDQMGP